MRVWRNVIWWLGLVLVFFTPLAWAGEPVVLDLETAIHKALALSPEVQEARAAIIYAKARQDEAEAWRWPQLSAVAVFGPVPKARGDQVYSPDNASSIHGLTWFARLEASLMQPLYTFGRISAMMAAAKEGAEVEEASLEQKSAETVFRVKEFYYGLLFALESQVLLEEINGFIADQRRSYERLLEVEGSSVTDLDLYRLDVYEARLAQFSAQAEKGVALAQEALAAVCGLGQVRCVPAEEYLKPIAFELKELAYYQAQALKKRPEMRQVTAGLAAAGFLVRAAEAERLPALFAAGLLSAAESPGRTDIDNPFINDEFNHLYGGLVLGATWQFNFGISQAKIAQAKAERLKIEAKDSLARMYIPLEVAQAYHELVESQARARAAKKAYKSARRWLVAASSNLDMGLGEARDAAEALENYALQRAAYFEAVMAINLDWARLNKAAGLDAGRV